MNRRRLAQQAFDIIREDLGNEVKEKEIWKAIAETNDEQLYNFVIYPQIREELLRKEKI